MTNLVPTHIKESADILRSYGRFGDTELVHLTTDQAALLKSMGGSGTINPSTGLPEFFGPLAALGAGVGAAFLANRFGGGDDGPQDISNSPLGRRIIAENERKRREAAEANARRIQGSRASDLAPDELMEQANNLLMRDRGRFAGTPRPQYQGQTVAPMSALTQRAQNLRSQYDSQPAPYSQRINTVLARPNNGFDPNALINPQLAQQRQFAGSNMMDIMRAQLGQASPNQNRFLEGAGREQEGVANVLRGNLGHMSNVASGLEAQRNQGIAEAFRGLQGNTQARRNAVIGGMTSMGHQRQAHENMRLGGERARFEEQAELPYRNMARLQQVLGNSADVIGDNGHIDLQKPQAREVMQALHAYGIDTSRPVSEWDTTRLPSQGVFQGQRTAPMTPEMIASQRMMEGVSPRMETPAADERRRLVQEMMDPRSLSDRALENVPEHVRPRIQALREEGHRTFRNNVGQINNRYTQLNQPFSEQNTREVEERALETARRLAQEEADILERGTGTQLSLQHERGTNDLRRLNEVGQAEQGDFRNMMTGITNLNNQGADRWRNNQRDLEDVWQNFQSSSPWGFSPQMRASMLARGQQEGREGALAEMNNPAHINNLRLDNPMLAQYGARYNELNREAIENRERISSESAAQNAREAAMHEAQIEAARERQQYEGQLAAQRQAMHDRANQNYNRRLGLYNAVGSSSSPLNQAAYDSLLLEMRPGSTQRNANNTGLYGPSRDELRGEFWSQLEGERRRF